MRDKLIHAYFGVDLSLVWYTIQNELDELENVMTKLLEGQK
ncbi:HepT-like ribonuclease domain-containing protein [Thermococcus celericrescens]|nr:HepT-like ribonuclease domain-containing protein [Thermococcus celericrescens]